MRLIDADKMIVYFKLWASNVKRILPQELAEICVTLFAEIIKEIKKQPTLDPESLRPKGEWEPYYEDVEIYNAGGFTERRQTGWTCRKCKRKKSFTPYKTSFCSSCGADMRGEGK